MVSREVFWSIPSEMKLYFYLAAAASVFIFLVGLWGRVSIWTLGRDDKDFNGTKTLGFLWFAITSFFKPDCMFGRKSFSLKGYRGLMLVSIIIGFLLLLAGTSILTLHHYKIPTGFLVNSPYLVFSFLMDFGGFILLIGLLISLGRRLLVSEVRRVTNRDDYVFLLLFLIITVTGFMIEGIRLAVDQPQNMDYAFVGAIFSKVFFTLSSASIPVYRLTWAVHVSSVFLLISLLPYSKFFHIVASQISVAAAKDRYGGAIRGRKD